MNEVLLREFIQNISAIVDRLSDSHRECVEVRDKLYSCTELAAACCHTNETLAETILNTLRTLEPHLTTCERKRLIRLADQLLSDSVNFLSAFDRH